MGMSGNARTGFKNIGRWLRYVQGRTDSLLVLQACDIATAKAQGKLGIILHTQGTALIEDELDAGVPISLGRVTKLHGISSRGHGRGQACQGTMVPNGKAMNSIPDEPTARSFATPMICCRGWSSRPMGASA